MTKKLGNIPEIFLTTRETSKDVSRMIKAGAARKLGPTLITTNMRDSPDSIVRRHVWQVLSLLAPGTVVSHRTAFENRPAPDGSMFVTGEYKRRIVLPGITIRQLKGPGPMENDMRYMDTLHLASRPRALMENLLPSRSSDKIAKTVGREEVEQRLAEMLQSGGEAELNRLRDEARHIAPALQMEEQFRELDRLIGALLRSQPAELTSPVARAYAAGEPYDPSRMPTFEALFAHLRSGSWTSRPDAAVEQPAFRDVAFYDAYFSNYIEGTEFPVEEAIRIVFEGERPVNRPADAHDILGTYRIVADEKEMRRLPTDFDDFIQLLKHRHAMILEGRLEMMPGRFKTAVNRAGMTFFVPPELVIGTLRQGYKMYEGLDVPLARALFMMFLIAEVHPFADGNGRIARVMMNAELVAQNQTRIFIPSVYRDEYVSSLKGLTNNHEPRAFARVMDYAQLFVSRIDFADLEAARKTLAAHCAFHDPADNVKLIMPR